MKALTASLVLLCVCGSSTNIRAAEPKPSWQSEWEKTVQGAKKEGKLSLYLFHGEGAPSAVAQLFQKKYPEIGVTTVTGSRSGERAWTINPPTCHTPCREIWPVSPANT
jgi:hypothetical protein